MKDLAGFTKFRINSALYEVERKTFIHILLQSPPLVWIFPHKIFLSFSAGEKVRAFGMTLSGYCGLSSFVETSSKWVLVVVSWFWDKRRAKKKRKSKLESRDNLL